MITSFVILIREGLEAALIIGIILAYLTKTNGRRQFSLVWTGVALGVLVSLVTGAVVYYAAGELEGPAEQIFEGTTMFIAVGVLTWMIFYAKASGQHPDSSPSPSRFSPNKPLVMGTGHPRLRSRSQRRHRDSAVPICGDADS